MDVLLRAPGPRQMLYVKSALLILGLAPLGRLVSGALTDSLGANPIEFITRSLGTWALTFLLVALAITPLRRLTGLHWLLRTRRMLGLLSYFYVVLHLSSYIVLDQFFDWAEIAKDIVERPFITVGLTAFLLMTPLAATSSNAMVRRLGGRRWQNLHRTVYAVAIFGVVHYWWLVKKDITQPLIYAFVLSTLLGARIVWRERERRQLDSACATARLTERTIRIASRRP